MTNLGRKHVLSRIDKSITVDSSKDSDKKLLQEFCNIADYQSSEFNYIKKN